MKPLRVVMVALSGLAALVGAACAQGAREFRDADDGSGGSGGQMSSSSTSSGIGGRPGTGGGGAGGQPGTGGSAGAGGAGGAGGAAPCVWIDITDADCSSGIMIANFCPAGRHVTQLERCTDGSLFTPDAAYQMYLLNGCPDTCPVAGDHVSWRRIECCL
jgi:hypothetical protein